MKRLNEIMFLGVMFICVSAIGAFAFTAEITAMEGDVKFLKAGASQWEAASVKTVLANGDKLESKEKSWAEISFSVGHQVKLGSNSFMLINQMGEKTSLELFKGDLLNKVRKLTRAESYEVTTPQAVASVKGTEFSVIVGADGETRILVYEGSVLAAEIKTGSEVLIPAGKYTTIIENQAPAEPDDLENLITGEESEKREEEKQEEVTETKEKVEEKVSIKRNIKKHIREEIREAVVDIKIDVAATQKIIETTKENDSATGRTLRDVHGNLVRVEQYVLRPNPETIQFINITKRSDYKYRGRMNIANTNARLDTLETTVTFNRGLPEKLSGWFNFFVDVENHDDENYFHPMSIKIKTSNQHDSIVMTSSWDESKKEMKEPVVKLISAKEGTWNVLTGVDYNDYTAGGDQSNIYNEANEGSGIEWGSDDSLEMWTISSKMLLYKDLDGNGIWDETEVNNTRWVRAGVEGWVINNEGQVIGINNIAGLGDTANPFDILRNIAFEVSCIYRDGYGIIGDSSYILNQLKIDEDLKANQDAALSGFNKADNFFSKNIDLVVTPDFAIPILEEIAKGATTSLEKM